VEKNRFEADDSIDQMIAKNSQMKEKMGIIVGTVEEQLSMIGHDIHSFFDTIDVKDSRSSNMKNPKKSSVGVNLSNVSTMLSTNGNRVVAEKKLKSKIDRMRAKLTKDEINFQAKDMENDLRVVHKKLVGLKMGFRDERMFFRNRKNSLKHVHSSVRKNKRYKLRSEQDFRVIKDEVSKQTSMLNATRS
jgi:hypothetical protein